ncbi:MAG: 3-isopropylmalate dehydrogenase [Clostridia bacterium]|nr:3-isopropylmalate dehydrogenase [Clostridia bacterium]MCI9086288.1 3-isopropylmalate dehydrogenase [Clostridia bacterium]
MSEFNIALIPGDGIGPEIVSGAVTVLNAVEKKYGHKFNYTEVYMGGCAIDKYGVPLPQETVDICKKSDSVLLGAVGGPKWDSQPSENRPEKGLLGIRKALGLYSNLRPSILKKQLKDASPLKDEKLRNGLDVMVVRELTGGIYFGKRTKGDDWASDEEKYSVEEITRIGKIAFETAMLRNKRVVSVDKANVLESSRLWRSVMEEIAKDYPEVTLTHMYVDNAAMQLVINPAQFDVIVTSNIFGDILSDLSSAIAGSIGMLPSASLGATKCGMYEPIHGSAPDIAGQDIANPIATIVSAAMMLEMSFGLVEEAKAINNAVDKVLDENYRTTDIMSDGMTKVGCKEMAKLIAENI